MAGVLVVARMCAFRLVGESKEWRKYSSASGIK